LLDNGSVKTFRGDEYTESLPSRGGVTSSRGGRRKSPRKRMTTLKRVSSSLLDWTRLKYMCNNRIVGRGVLYEVRVVSNT
jgi:hypothetical protein